VCVCVCVCYLCVCYLCVCYLCVCVCVCVCVCYLCVCVCARVCICVCGLSPRRRPPVPDSDVQRDPERASGPALRVCVRVLGLWGRASDGPGTRREVWVRRGVLVRTPLHARNRTRTSRWARRRSGSRVAWPPPARPAVVPVRQQRAPAAAGNQGAARQLVSTFPLCGQGRTLNGRADPNGAKLRLLGIREGG
jgi:hypothetical protein